MIMKQRKGEWGGQIEKSSLPGLIAIGPMPASFVVCPSILDSCSRPPDFSSCFGLRPPLTLRRRVAVRGK